MEEQIIAAICGQASKQYTVERVNEKMGISQTTFFNPSIFYLDDELASK